MHGTDVVFLGVSVDEAKDKQKWLDFIETEGLKGIQLLANGWSKITKDYKINGIPRFMVFDKKGNIVSADAPRPSNPELKKMLEAERKRVERASRKKKLTRAELKEKAETDPAAAKEWETMKAKEAEARQRKKEREEARMSSDPEYAAMREERRKEYNRRHTEKRRLEHEALVALAKTDEEAARKLAEKRKYQSEATVRSYQKLKAEADAGNPEAVQRYEAHLAKRREEYHKKKEEKEVISA